MAEKKAVKHYRNMDNFERAIDGLSRFRHSFCMNVAKTKGTDDLVFRCGECPFEREDNKCAVKLWLQRYATKEQFAAAEVIAR